MLIFIFQTVSSHCIPCTYLHIFILETQLFKTKGLYLHVFQVECLPISIVWGKLFYTHRENLFIWHHTHWCSALLLGTWVHINVGMSKITKQLLWIEKFICCLKNVINSHQIHDFTGKVRLLCPAEKKASLTGQVSITLLQNDPWERNSVQERKKEFSMEMGWPASSHRSIPARPLPLSSGAQSPTAEHYSSDLPLCPYRDRVMLF